MIPRAQLLAFLSALAVLHADVASGAENIAGRASVVDGDTIEIHGTRVRLWGVDAPESDQLCRGDDSEDYRCGQRPRLRDPATNHLRSERPRP